MLGHLGTLWNCGTGRDCLPRVSYSLERANNEFASEHTFHMQTNQSKIHAHIYLLLSDTCCPGHYPPALNHPRAWYHTEQLETLPLQPRHQQNYSNYLVLILLRCLPYLTHPFL